MAGFFNSVVGFIRKFADPKMLVADKRFAQEEIRKLIKAGEIEIIHSGHPNEKLAALASAYEKMTEHPLRKFAKGPTPKLILNKNNAVIPGGGFASAASPAFIGKYISVTQAAVDVLTPKELEVMTAHEFGHFLQQEVNPRRGWKMYKGMKERESGADQISTLLMGEDSANHLASGLKKLTEHQRQISESAMKEIATTSPKLAKALEWSGKIQERFGSTHPSLSKRTAAAAQTAEDMAKGNKSFTEQEIARRLRKIDRALHPHQFERNLPNTRA